MFLSGIQSCENSGKIEVTPSAFAEKFPSNGRPGCGDEQSNSIYDCSDDVRRSGRVTIIHLVPAQYRKCGKSQNGHR